MFGHTPRNEVGVRFSRDVYLGVVFCDYVEKMRYFNSMGYS